MNLTKEEQDRLLVEAKEKYYEEVEFISVLDKRSFIIPKNPYFFFDDIAPNMIRVQTSPCHVPVIYRYGKWAEIIPNEEAQRRYYIELLKEKESDFILINQNLTEAYKKEIEDLTTTITEKDKEIQACKDMVLKEGLEFRKASIELRDNYNNRLDEIQKEAEQSLTEAKATIDKLKQYAKNCILNFAMNSEQYIKGYKLLEEINQSIKP